MKTSKLRSLVAAASLATAAGLGPSAGAQQIDGGGSEASGGATGTLVELRSARDALLAASDFPAALDPAERIVEMLEAEEAAGIGDDVLRLARIQAGLQDFEAAELNYLKAIDLIEEEQGEFSPQLMTSYQALGRTYLNSRRFPEAIAVLEQAQTISRRNEGLFNVEQSGLIDDITLAYLGSGDTVEARELQLSRLENAVRRFGPDDARLIPFHNHLGEYYDNSRLRLSAREQYSKALELSETHYGADSAESVSLLRRLAQIDLVLGHPTDTRDRLMQALEHSSDLAATERGLTLATLGDWALIDQNFELARSYYRDAFGALAGNADFDTDTFFGEPRMLDFIPPLSPVDRGARSRPWTWGEIVLQFDVSTTGRASNVEIVSMEPRVQRVANAYNRRIRETHFRPRLTGGESTATQAVRYTHSFRYYVEEDD